MKNSTTATLRLHPATNTEQVKEECCTPEKRCVIECCNSIIEENAKQCGEHEPGPTVIMKNTAINCI